MILNSSALKRFFGLINPSALKRLFGFINPSALKRLFGLINPSAFKVLNSNEGVPINMGLNDDFYIVFVP